MFMNVITGYLSLICFMCMHTAKGTRQMIRKINDKQTFERKSFLGVFPPNAINHKLNIKLQPTQNLLTGV